MNSALRTPHSALPAACLAELEAARTALTKKLVATDRRVAGFKRGDVDLIKRPDGSYNEGEILRGTYFECFFCGSHWLDDGRDGKTRVALDESSHYIAARPEARPGWLGFNVPQWINRRIGWGEIMLNKLEAQRTADETGNFEPLKIWWQKRAARSWERQLSAKQASHAAASQYDLQTEKQPGEKVRVASVDVQFHMTHMIYLAVAVGDPGVPDKVLAFEWIKPPPGFTENESREFCKNRVRELNKVWGIQQQNCMIDGAHELDLVREWAAEDAVLARGQDRDGRIRPQWFHYGILRGDDKLSYRWKLPGRKTTWERYSDYFTKFYRVMKDGKLQAVPIHYRLWSNWSIKEITARWRDGNSALKLQIHEKFLADAGKEGLWMQLTSEEAGPWKNHPGKMRYNEIAGRPNHAWDCLNMITVRKDVLGLLNQFGAPEAEE